MIDLPLLPPIASDFLLIMQSSDSYGTSWFSQLLRKAGFRDTQDIALPFYSNLTVWAPTDEAFMAMNQEDLTRLESPIFYRHAAEFVLNHISAPALSRQEWASRAPGNITMLNGVTYELKTTFEEPRIYGSASNQGRSYFGDVIALDGYVHMIDSVITPTAVSFSLYDHCNEDPDFSSLVRSLQEVDIVDIVDRDLPLTLLAPNDKAFERIGPTGLELQDILRNHLFRGLWFLDLLGNGTEITSVNDVTHMVEVFGDKTYVGGAYIYQADILGRNGVLHQIDRVIGVEYDTIPPTITPAPSDLSAEPTTYPTVPAVPSINPTSVTDNIVVCVDGFETPGCNANALSDPLLVFQNPISGPQSSCSTDGDLTTCPVDMNVFIFGEEAYPTYLDAAISCPLDSVSQSDFIQKTKDPEACDCQITSYYGFEPPEQTPGQGPNRPYDGQGAVFDDCQCLLCPPGSVARFAASCARETLWSCKSWNCEGICDEEPDFIVTSPTVAPEEPFVPNDPLECLEGYDIDGKCTANALSDPVIVFDSDQSSSCLVKRTGQEPTISCPFSMDLFILGDDDDANQGPVYIAANITCPLLIVKETGFRSATKVPNLCSTKISIESSQIETADEARQLQESGSETDHCVWHVCPVETLSLAAVTCRDELVPGIRGFSCNGVANGPLDYLPEPATEENPDPATALVFRDPLSEAEKSKTVSLDNTTVSWKNDMVVAEVTDGQDLEYYISSQFKCNYDNEIETDQDFFDYTRTYGNCGCTISVLDPDVSDERAMENCICHTCHNAQDLFQYATSFALRCESALVPGCNSISCDGSCNGVLFFFPSPSPTISPSLGPTTTESSKPSLASSQPTTAQPTPQPTPAQNIFNPTPGNSEPSEDDSGNDDDDAGVMSATQNLSIVAASGLVALSLVISTS